MLHILTFNNSGLSPWPIEGSQAIGECIQRRGHQWKMTQPDFLASFLPKKWKI